MSAAPCPIALALLEQDGRRALPLQGTSLRQPLAAGVDPGKEDQRQALELLARVWQRSEDGPLRLAAGPSSLLLATLPIEALMDQTPLLKARGSRAETPRSWCGACGGWVRLCGA